MVVLFVIQGLMISIDCSLLQQRGMVFQFEVCNVAEYKCCSWNLDITTISSEINISQELFSNLDFPSQMLDL